MRSSIRDRFKDEVLGDRQKGEDSLSLEQRVDLGLGTAGEALLLPVVLVAKIAALAGGLEGEPEGVAESEGAAVAGPV